MSLIYGYVAKLILESEFQHKGNKQTKKREFSANLVFFFFFFFFFCWQEQIQKIKILKILQRKGFKNSCTKLSSLGQEPTFNIQVTKIHALTRVE